MMGLRFRTLQVSGRRSETRRVIVEFPDAEIAHVAQEAPELVPVVAVVHPQRSHVFRVAPTYFAHPRSEQALHHLGDFFFRDTSLTASSPQDLTLMLVRVFPLPTSGRCLTAFDRFGVIVVPFGLCFASFATRTRAWMFSGANAEGADLLSFATPGTDLGFGGRAALETRSTRLGTNILLTAASTGVFAHNGPRVPQFYPLGPVCAAA